MARRIELRSVCHDILSNFISRNNDLHGYWALGQLRNAMERCHADRMTLSLTGEDQLPQCSECAELSERYSEMLRRQVSARRLKLTWIQDAMLTVEMVDTDRMRCSARVVTDLARSFEQRRDVLVFRHDPAREGKRVG